MRHFRITKGDAPGRGPAAASDITDAGPPGAAAILGADLPGLRPRFMVAEGDCVGVGQPLFTDRRHPQVVVVAPVSGRVAQAALGPRRTLARCVVTADPEQDAWTSPPMDTAQPRATLLARGLWPAFRARPFGRVPGPDAVPKAILVNAVQATPRALDPFVVIGAREALLLRGLDVLEALTEGKVYLTQSPGPPLVADTPRREVASFSGTAAAGLVGTQIDRLCPINGAAEVWSIGLQDVLAIGALFETGRYDARRVVSVAPAGTDAPRLVRTCLGARLSDLPGLSDGAAPVGAGQAAYLGRYDDAVAPFEGLPQTSWQTANSGRRPLALLPTRALDRALAVDLLTVPLLRALSIGDSDAARRLGCLALIEEDVAALSRCCTSGADYGVLLRRVLDELMGRLADEAA